MQRLQTRQVRENLFSGDEVTRKLLASGCDLIAKAFKSGSAKQSGKHFKELH